MSANSSPPTPELARTVQNGKRKTAKTPVKLPWFWLLLVSSVIFGIYLSLQAPREIGRWYLAAAAEHWTEAEYARALGDSSRATESREKAFACLDEALKRNPEEIDWIFQRAVWKSEAGKFEEALADCKLVGEKVGEPYSVLLLRSQFYQHLGKHAEAVADMEQINALSKLSGSPTRANALNGLSYVKAVGKIDLPQALKDSDESVRAAVAEVQRIEEDNKSEPENIILRLLWQLMRDLTQEGRMAEERAMKMELTMRLDTRGFVNYQLGHFQDALKDLQLAAEKMDDLLYSPAEVTLLRKRSPDGRKVDIKVSGEKQTAAVIFYHRALAHEKLGNASAAEADRKRVRELIGRDGDESLF